MRLAFVVALMALLLPGTSWAQDDDEDLAPLRPTTPKPKIARPKKKPAPEPAKPVEPKSVEPLVPAALTPPQPVPSQPQDVASPQRPAVEPSPEVPQSEPPVEEVPPGAQLGDPELHTRQLQPAPRLASTVGWIIGGVGVATVVTGSVLAGLASASRAGLQVDPSGVVQAAQAAQASAAVRLARLSTVLFISGGLAAAGGLILALWPASSSPPRALRLVPSVGSGATALFLEGVWP